MLVASSCVGLDLIITQRDLKLAPVQVVMQSSSEEHQW